MDYDYFQRVKSMHEKGDDESLGWRCEWKESEATKLIMRTHTTGISSQMLKSMGDEYKKVRGTDVCITATNQPSPSPMGTTMFVGVGLCHYRQI